MVVSRSMRGCLQNGLEEGVIHRVCKHNRAYSGFMGYGDLFSPASFIINSWLDLLVRSA